MSKSINETKKQTKYMELVETFDADKLFYIINNFKDFKTQMRWRKKFDTFSPVQLISKYLHRSRHGSNIVNYKQNEGSGRFFAVGSLSLQSIPREIRHTISRDFYIDLDMVNAHPVILSYLCYINNFDCKYLNKYIKKREYYLSKIKDDDGKVVSRDKGKLIYLSLTNGGTKDLSEIKTPTHHLLQYKDEMIKIHKFFSQMNIEAFHVLKKKRIESGIDFNHMASFTNTLLCDFENKLLMDIYNFMDKPKNAVLCFDGIMLKKGVDYDINACMKYLDKKYAKLNMKIKIKDMNDHFDLTDVKLTKYKYKSLEYFIDYKNLITKDYDVCYPEWVKEWVDNAIVLIADGGSQFFLTKNKSVNPDSKKGFEETTIHYKPVKVDKVMTSLSVNCRIYHHAYKFTHLTLGAGNRQKGIGYLKDKMERGEIQTFGKSDFVPFLERKGIPILYECFNVFTGFPLDHIDIKHDDIKFEDTLIYKHLKEIMFNNDPGELNHFLDHLADILQDPYNIKPNAHLFYSKQGTGKGVLGEWFKRLVGMNHVATIINLDRYFKSSFNVHHCHKLLKIFEEVADKGQAYTQYNRLKGEISSKVEDVEPKGIDSWQVANCARMWFFTNNENSLYIEGDDRRYTLHKVNNSKADDMNYFIPIWAEIKDMKYLKCAFEFLANRKYDPESARKCYNTKYKGDQKINNLPNGIKFIKSFIEKTFKQDDMKEVVKTTKIRARFLLDKYKNWCIENGTKYNASTLKTQLKKIDIQDPKRLRFEGGKAVLCYNLNIKKVELDIQAYLKHASFKFDFGINTTYKISSLVGHGASTDSDEDF